jgi:hypothetical protein
MGSRGFAAGPAPRVKREQGWPKPLPKPEFFGFRARGVMSAQFPIGNSEPGQRLGPAAVRHPVAYVCREMHRRETHDDIVDAVLTNFVDEACNARDQTTANEVESGLKQ